jgi:hypothetical protein
MSACLDTERRENHEEAASGPKKIGWKGVATEPARGNLLHCNQTILAHWTGCARKTKPCIVQGGKTV